MVNIDYLYSFHDKLHGVNCKCTIIDIVKLVDSECGEFRKHIIDSQAPLFPCKKCGELSLITVKFCPKCNAKLGNDKV